VVFGSRRCVQKTAPHRRVGPRRCIPLVDHLTKDPPWDPILVTSRHKPLGDLFWMQLSLNDLDPLLQTAYQLESIRTIRLTPRDSESSKDILRLLQNEVQELQDTKCTIRFEDSVFQNLSTCLHFPNDWTNLAKRLIDTKIHK